ncbi:MAG: hypothetical protein Q9166_002959 [cf. Caloplaca sp. 2 TL-2023]
MAELSDNLPLKRYSVETAHQVIKEHIHRTPVVTSTTLNNSASTPQSPEALIGTTSEGQRPARPKIHLFFKCENYQRIGELDQGNHAQALALAAHSHGIKAYIVMPTISTPSKIAATKGYGAEVVFSGSTSQEREAVVEDVMKRTNATLIPPYDHPDIILGQGTMALELEEQVRELVQRDGRLSVRENPSRNQNGHFSTNGIPEDVIESHDRQAGRLDAVIAPLGGGGMLAGIATALSGRTRVFGAEPSFEGADDGRRGLEANQRVTNVKTLTIADGLRTPVGKINWTVISDKSKVKGVFAVTEEQIVSAMRLVIERMKIFVEPSAVVGLAVVLYDEGFRKVVEEEGEEEGWDIGVILSGGNTTLEAVSRMFATGEKNAERAEGKVARDGDMVAENVAG